MIVYYKIIDGERVDFPGYIKDDEKGVVYYNPTESLILAYGWIKEEIIDPIPEPTPQGEPDMDTVLNKLKVLALPTLQALDDEDALAVMECFPTWESLVGKAVTAGERIWDDGKLFRVVQSHTVQEDWRPAELPALYTQVTLDEWPEWRQPTGAQDAYNKGDKVTFEGKHYISLIDGNTWSPASYPAGWELVE
jgi:hypothetical protein